MAQAGSGQQKKPGAGAPKTEADSSGATQPANPKSGSPKPANSAPAGSGNVTYLDLKSTPPKVALPYGQPFTITGDTKDVQINGAPLSDLMQAQTVAGDYTTSDGNKGTITSSSTTSTSWKAGIGKLNADTSVTINFQFTGTLAAGTQQKVIPQMLADPGFKAAITQYEKSAEGKDTATAVGAMTLLSQAVVDVVTSVMNQSGLTPKDPVGLKGTLAPVLLTNIENIYNLPKRIPEIRDPDNGYADLVGMKAPDFSALNEKDLYDKLKGADYSKLPADTACWRREAGLFSCMRITAPCWKRPGASIRESRRSSTPSWRQRAQAVRSSCFADSAEADGMSMETIRINLVYQPN